MRKWWRGTRKEDVSDVPASPSPCGQVPQEKVAVEKAEARAAIKRSLEDQRRTGELSDELHEVIDFLKAAREEDDFPRGIVEMIREGR